MAAGAHLRQRDVADLPPGSDEAEEAEREQQHEVQAAPDAQEGAVQRKAALEGESSIDEEGDDEEGQAEAEQGEDFLEGVHDEGREPGHGDGQAGHSDERQPGRQGLPAADR